LEEEKEKRKRKKEREKERKRKRKRKGNKSSAQVVRKLKNVKLHILQMFNANELRS
jgi:hypothetical protein